MNVQAIYQRYLQAFKKGAYNYIKEEQDPITQQPAPRKYFSGGENLTSTSFVMDQAMATIQNVDFALGPRDKLSKVEVRLDGLKEAEGQLAYRNIISDGPAGTNLERSCNIHFLMAWQIFLT